MYDCVIGDGSTDSNLKEQKMWLITSCALVVVNVHFAGVRKLLQKILLKVCILWYKKALKYNGITLNQSKL